MYDSARSRVRIGSNLSEEFSVKVGVQEGSCLSPLLFVTVLETLSQEFRPFSVVVVPVGPTRNAVVSLGL